MRLVCFVLIITLAACKKDDDRRSNADLLTTGSWHVIAYTVDPAIDWDGDGTKESDIFPVMDQCITDDHTTFFEDGTGELDEGATKCNDGDPQTIRLNWVLDDNEKGITIQGVHYLLESLTATQLVVKEIEVVSADTYTHRVTFAH